MKTRPFIRFCFPNSGRSMKTVLYLETLAVLQWMWIHSIALWFVICSPNMHLFPTPTVEIHMGSYSALHLTIQCFMGCRKILQSQVICCTCKQCCWLHVSVSCITVWVSIHGVAFHLWKMQWGVKYFMAQIFLIKDSGKARLNFSFLFELPFSWGTLGTGFEGGKPVMDS